MEDAEKEKQRDVSLQYFLTFNGIASIGCAIGLGADGLAGDSVDLRDSQ